MRRTATILMVIALAPLLMGGGINPPPPGGTTQKVTGPAVSAVVVINPAFTGTSATAGNASIRLQKGTLVSGATFISVPVLSWSQGCDTANVVTQTDTRFLYSAIHDNRLADWIPNATSQMDQGNVLENVFAGVGINISANPRSAVITDIDNAVCTTDLTGAGTNPAVLSFQAVIQFTK